MLSSERFWGPGVVARRSPEILSEVCAFVVSEWNLDREALDAFEVVIKPDNSRCTCLLGDVSVITVPAVDVVFSRKVETMLCP